MLDKMPGSNDLAYFVDNSILSTFQACPEKARLSFRSRLTRSGDTRLPFVFGGAFHEGLARHIVGDPLKDAQRAFVEHAKANSEMEVNIESSDRRSIERGINLLEAYYERWADSPYRVYTTPEGVPYTEIGFKLFFGDWVDGIPIILTGTIDGIVRDSRDDSIGIMEHKTTTSSLANYLRQTKPNQQLSIYDYAVHELLKLETSWLIWNCVYVSDRKPNPKGDKWAVRGIDIKNDFGRATTRRTSTDRSELMFNLTYWIKSYLTWYTNSEDEHWPQVPQSCFQYGSCQFLDVCLSHRNALVLSSLYERSEWKPWEQHKTNAALEKRFIK